MMFTEAIVYYAIPPLAALICGIVLWISGRSLKNKPMIISGITITVFTISLLLLLTLTMTGMGILLLIALPYIAIGGFSGLLIASIIVLICGHIKKENKTIALGFTFLGIVITFGIIPGILMLTFGLPIAFM